MGHVTQYRVVYCVTLRFWKRKGEAFASPNILLRLFCHEAIVIFIPLGFVFVFEFWDEGILAYLANRCFTDRQPVIVDEDLSECLGYDLVIDAEGYHSLCELELELELCHKDYRIFQAD